MAWQAVTFSCGCEGHVQVYGPTRDRQRKADWIAGKKDCDDCFTAQLAKDRAEKLASAKVKAEEWELPDLTGSEKQVAWAMRIRNDFVSAVQSLTDRAEEKHLELCGEPAQSILAEDEARFWIDNSHRFNPISLLTELPKILRQRSADLKKDVETPTVVLRPERDPISVVSLSLNGAEIRIWTERREADEFIEFLKRKGARWSSPYWTIKIGPESVPPEHVAASLASDILARGYSVSSRDSLVVELVRNDAFERPNPRRVSASTDGKLFHLRTERDRPDDLWTKMKALPGAKWDDGLKIPAKAAGEVADLADRLGFYVSPGARKIIEAHETIIVGKSQVAPAALASTKVQPTPVRGEIHADLRDE